MSTNKRNFYKLPIVAAVFCVMISAVMTPGQTAPQHPLGVPDDWTHHRVVFSNPGTAAEALGKGRFEHWYRVVNDPRYQMQQWKRKHPTPPAPPPPPTENSPLERDWSMNMGGVAASQTGTVNTNNAGSTSSVTVDGVVLSAAPPTAASATGTFTGNPTNAQTVTLGGSEVLTASASTAATASITVGSSFCIAPGQGVTINGTALTTNATAGTGTFVVNSTPTSGSTVVIGGVTYTFETTLSGTTPANEVLISANTTNMARNLAVAINNSGTCGSTSGGVCTRNVTAANPKVSSTNNTSATQTMTSLCADNAAITNTGAGAHVTVNTVAAASSAGTNTATTFALNAASTTPASQTVTAQNIVTAVNANPTTSPLVTASYSASSPGTASLVADTWGTGGNSITLAQSATSGVSVSGGTFSGGANGTNTGTSFAIDNNTTDDATNLASAITRNGGTVGVTATSAGAVVTVTATTAGTGGNSISLVEGLSNFTWSGSDLSGGGSGNTTGTTFAYSGLTPTQVATNIATAINANTTLQTVSTGVSATSSGDVVTVTARTVGTGGNSYAVAVTNFPGFTWNGADLSGGTGSTAATVGAGTFPAKYSFSSTTANCDNATTPDFVIYNTGLAGSATEPSIVAYDNLYSGCPTSSVPVPNVYWQYNTGGTITTSPVLSMDGTQVVFVQTNASSQAQLVLLKWSEGSALQTLTSQTTAAAYTTCTAPCMYAITFASTKLYGAAGATVPNDTYSSPFYDYIGDAVYVGENNGYTHKFTPVFNGAPAEVNGSGWPIQTSSAPLNSPVYDAYAGYVFVGPAIGGNSCSAYMHRIATTGTATITNLQTSLGVPTASTDMVFYDAPIADPSALEVYVFVNDDGNATAPSAAVWQIPYAFAAGSPTEAKVGNASATSPMFAGQFDNIYETASGPVGNLYVCGRDASTQEPALWRVPINTTMGTPVEIGALTTAATNCSPLTEFYNTSTSTDYVFLSVQASSSLGTCGGAGCIMSFNVTTALGAGASPTATLTEAGGTSGIAVDNAVGSSTLAGASQVYFSPLASQPCAGNGATGSGTGGCAIQASQAGLK